MVRRFLKHFDHDNIAADGKFEQDWDSDADYIVRAIFITRKDGADFTASEITIRIHGDSLTDPEDLCMRFGSDKLDYLPIDEDLRKGWKIEWEGYNREGTTISIVVTLWLEKV